jgi:hypothetical protein
VKPPPPAAAATAAPKLVMVYVKLKISVSDFAATDLPLPVLIPKRLGLGFNKTCQQLGFNKP